MIYDLLTRGLKVENISHAKECRARSGSIQASNFKDLQLFVAINYMYYSTFDLLTVVHNDTSPKKWRSSPSLRCCLFEYDVC